MLVDKWLLALIGWIRKFTPIEMKQSSLEHLMQVNHRTNKRTGSLNWNLCISVSKPRRMQRDSKSIILIGCNSHVTLQVTFLMACYIIIFTPGKIYVVVYWQQNNGVYLEILGRFDYVKGVLFQIDGWKVIFLFQA